MVEIPDQMGRTVRLTEPPRRIVSLVPSLTELLFDLGLGDEIVGVTDYCSRPTEQTSSRTRVGGPKDFRVSDVLALRPELVIGSREENDPERIRRLEERVPVWLSDVTTVEGALEMIGRVGALTGRAHTADDLIEEIAAGLERLKPLPPLRTAYLIWKDPWMAAGGGTFIDAMLRTSGLTNHFGERARYPRITLDELRGSQVVLLPSEPYPFSREDVGIIERSGVTGRVSTVDGALFSWYGSRMRYAPAGFEELRLTLPNGE